MQDQNVRNRQQAADVPHSALAAQVPALASSLKAYGKKTYKGRNQVKGITLQSLPGIELYYKIACRGSNRLFS